MEKAPIKRSEDAYGQQLLTQYNNQEETTEIIERDDRFIAAGSTAGRYFFPYEKWSPAEQEAIRLARGRVLDIGCGAGRAALYLQGQGFDVTGIDNSPGAVKVCKLRGLRKAILRPIAEVGKFKPDSFDTVLMFGNNFGLFGSATRAKSLLRELRRITLPTAVILAQSRDPYQTTNPDHLAYHKRNKARGRMAGQIRMRVRFGKIVGRWFDYLLVSPEEMKEILQGTGWQVERFLSEGGSDYIAVIGKVGRQPSP